MTQELSLVSLSNDYNVLKVIGNNTTSDNGTDATLEEENDKQLRNMSGKVIITKLSILENHLNHISNIFTEYLSELVDLNLCNSELNALPNSLNMLKKLTFLNLDNNQFSSLPNVICELCNLKKLWACKNKMKQVPNNLGNLSNLEILSLSMNRLTDLPNSCGKLNKLEVCCLSDNKFKRIPDCVAKGMKNLQILVLSRNSRLELDIYPKSTNLTSFYAEENDICPSFPKWLLSSKYKKLETAALNGTRFQTFNYRKKTSISYIKRLSMKQCNLQEEHVEKIIAGMTNLEELVIGNNKVKFQNNFSSMPVETKKKLSSLKKIDIRDTGLVVVPNTINKFVGISDLNLSSNNIFTLPEEICCLKNLSRLIVDNNRLANLPKNIGDLISLRELKARQNHLYKLPESMKLLSNLEYMDLYNNEFETIPEAIPSLSSLKGLDLEQNYFSTEYISHTRAPCYRSRREALRNYWTDSLFGYESVCGPKLKLVLDNKNMSSSSSSKSSLSGAEGALCALPEATFKALMNERWDSSEDSADEFDPHECRIPRKRYYSPFKYFNPYQQMYLYCPADFHPPRVVTRVTEMLSNGSLIWPSSSVEGQFEDP